MINDLVVANKRIKELEAEVAKVRWEWSKCLARENKDVQVADSATDPEVVAADTAGNRLMQHYCRLAEEYGDLKEKYLALAVNSNHKVGFRLLDDNEGHWYLVPSGSVVEFNTAIDNEQDPTGIDGVVYINGPVSKVIIHNFSLLAFRP